jgi:hypothetical protein
LIRSRSRLFAPAIALLASVSCAGEGIFDPVAPAPDCSDELPFRAQLSCIQESVFTPGCALVGCHAAPLAAQGLDLSSGMAHTALVDSPSTETALSLVEPGNPDDSYLIIKLEGLDPRLVGDRMPQGGPFLSQAEIDVLRRWILDGALDD